MEAEDASENTSDFARRKAGAFVLGQHWNGRVADKPDCLSYCSDFVVVLKARQRVPRLLKEGFLLPRAGYPQLQTGLLRGKLPRLCCRRTQRLAV